MDATLSPRARATIAWITAGIVVLVLAHAAHALLPFAWAVIVAYLLNPVVSLIHRRIPLPRQIITILLFLVIGVVVTVAALNLAPRLLSQIAGLQQQTIPGMVQGAEAWFAELRVSDPRFAALDARFIQDRIELLGSQTTALLSREAVPLLRSTFTLAIEFFVFIVASFYLIVHGDRLVMFIRTSLNHRYHREFDRLLVDVNSTLGAYLRGQLLLLVIMSTASYIALSVLRVDYALTLAVATGVLELIPLIGPWTAGTIAVLIALFQPVTPFGWSNATLAIVIALVYFTLRQLEDAFVIPQVIGRLVHLHPLLVIFALVVGTTLGGPLGLILAVPMAAVVKIVATFIFAKWKASEHRIIETVTGRDDLDQLLVKLPGMTNATVVVLIRPGALEWDDLGAIERLAGAAAEAGADLSAVAADSIAGSLTTAAGIPTTTLPIGQQVDSAPGSLALDAPASAIR